MSTQTIPEINERWHWKCDPFTKLEYVGKAGHWHQFEKVDEPGKVWCEVLTEDLRLLEKTNENGN